MELVIFEKEMQGPPAHSHANRAKAARAFPVINNAMKTDSAPNLFIRFNLFALHISRDIGTEPNALFWSQFREDL